MSEGWILVEKIRSQTLLEGLKSISYPEPIPTQANVTLHIFTYLM